MIVAALGDEDWRVRKEATFAARELLPEAPLIAALVSALGTGDVGLCNAAVEVLGAAGASATPLLDAALSTLGADGRKLAVEALGRTRDREALAPLERALREADPNIRQTAVESVAALGAVAPDAVERLLLSVLGDTDPIVRLGALSGLDALGAKVPFEQLEPLLEEPALRPLALAAVARAGHAAAPVVLARALGSSSGRTFEAALMAFAHVPLEPLSEAALAALRACEPALSGRLAAVARSGGEEAIERRRLALLLGAALGDAQILPVAVSALGEPGLGSAALSALEQLGEPALLALVARLAEGAADPMEDEVGALHVDAIAHLALQRSERLPAVLDALRRAARGTGPKTAARALHALGSLGEAEDLALAEAISLGTDSAVVFAAEAALAALAARYAAAARSRRCASSAMPSRAPSATSPKPRCRRTHRRDVWPSPPSRGSAVSRRRRPS